MSGFGWRAEATFFPLDLATFWFQCYPLGRVGNTWLGLFQLDDLLKSIVLLDGFSDVTDLGFDVLAFDVQKK